MGTAAKYGRSGALAPFLVITEKHQKVSGQSRLSISSMFSLENEHGSICSLAVVFRLALNLPLAVKGSLSHKYKEQAGCQTVVTTIYLMVGI